VRLQSGHETTEGKEGGARSRGLRGSAVEWYDAAAGGRRASTSRSNWGGRGAVDRRVGSSALADRGNWRAGGDAVSRRGCGDRRVV